jgi:hypothetical protein
MEHKRRQLHIEQLRLELIRTEKAQEREEETLKIIPKLNLGSEIALRKKTDMKLSIEKRALHIEQLRERIRHTSEGKLDNELSEQADQESKLYNSKREAALRKKRELLQEDDDKKEIMNRKTREKENKHIEKDYSYFYKVYQSIEASVPDYIRENLKSMPNNKGYIWRGCWFLGELSPEHGQPMVLFEKVRGGVTRIHEVDDYEIRIFEKQGKEKKKLISKKRRNMYILGKNRF